MFPNFYFKLNKIIPSQGKDFFFWCARTTDSDSGRKTIFNPRAVDVSMSQTSLSLFYLLPFCPSPLLSSAQMASGRKYHVEGISSRADAILSPAEICQGPRILCCAFKDKTPFEYAIHYVKPFFIAPIRAPTLHGCNIERLPIEPLFHKCNKLATPPATQKMSDRCLKGYTHLPS